MPSDESEPQWVLCVQEQKAKRTRQAERKDRTRSEPYLCSKSQDVWVAKNTSRADGARRALITQAGGAFDAHQWPTTQATKALGAYHRFKAYAWGGPQSSAAEVSHGCTWESVGDGHHVSGNEARLFVLGCGT